MTTYQAQCKMHAYLGEDREEYADATADLAAHLESEHWAGVVTLTDEP